MIDNCEHVAASVAELVGALLSGCPLLAVLLTSRTTLGMAGEEVLRLGPMDLDLDATALFMDRARAVRPEVSLDEWVGRIREICAALDGMPLAIELAASRMRTLSVPEVAQRLTQRRLPLRAPASTEPRHATLAAVMDWSIELLGELTA